MQPQCVSSGSVNSDLRFVFQAFHYFEVISMQVLLNPGRYHPAFISILYSVSWLHPSSVTLDRLAHAPTYMYRRVLLNAGNPQPSFISLHSITCWTDWHMPPHTCVDGYCCTWVTTNPPSSASCVFTVSWSDFGNSWTHSRINIEVLLNLGITTPIPTLPQPLPPKSASYSSELVQFLVCKV